MELASLVLGVTLFAITNIDDVFVLLGFFADPRFRAREIVLGQYGGMCVLIGASLIVALISLALPSEYVGLLGLAPLAIGIKKLWELRAPGEGDHEEVKPDAGKSGFGNILSVAAVTIANGGDNIGVYAPLFATRSASSTTVIVLTFLLMTGVWCWFSHWLVSHRTMGAPIRRYGRRLLPFVLIALGCSILYEAGTLALLMS